MSGDVWLMISMVALLVCNISAMARMQSVLIHLEQIQRMLAAELRERENDANNVNG